MKQGFDGDRALYTLTLGEFFELLDQHLEASAYGANQRSDFPASTGRLVFGLKGIQELLGCSHKDRPVLQGPRHPRGRPPEWPQDCH